MFVIDRRYSDIETNEYDSKNLKIIISNILSEIINEEKILENFTQNLKFVLQFFEDHFIQIQQLKTYLLINENSDQDFPTSLIQKLWREYQKKIKEFVHKERDTLLLNLQLFHTKKYSSSDQTKKIKKKEIIITPPSSVTTRNQKKNQKLYFSDTFQSNPYSTSKYNVLFKCFFCESTELEKWDVICNNPKCLEKYKNQMKNQLGFQFIEKPLTISPSLNPFAGLGVFSHSYYSPGEIITEYTGKRYTIKKLSKEKYEEIQIAGYAVEIDGKFIIDGRVSEQRPRIYFEKYHFFGSLINDSWNDPRNRPKNTRIVIDSLNNGRNYILDDHKDTEDSDETDNEKDEEREDEEEKEEKEEKEEMYYEEIEFENKKEKREKSNNKTKNKKKKKKKKIENTRCGLFIEATEKILPGDELLLDYGPTYWNQV